MYKRDETLDVYSISYCKVTNIHNSLEMKQKIKYFQPAKVLKTQREEKGIIKTQAFRQIPGGRTWELVCLVGCGV